MLVYRVTATIPVNNRVVVGGILNQDLSLVGAKNLAASIEKDPRYKDFTDIKIEFREVTPWEDINHKDGAE